MDIMLDLETLGTRCGSVILSIGACVFDRSAIPPGWGPAPGWGPTPWPADWPVFHAFLKPSPQVGLGATIDPSTVLWWLGQSAEARNAMLAGQASAVRPAAALAEFAMWLDKVCGKVPERRVWANGSDFDISLLANLYQRFGMESPWPYNGARDMRTVMDLAGKKPKEFLPAPTGAHDALVDAMYQARVTILALRHINGN